MQFVISKPDYGVRRRIVSQFLRDHRSSCRPARRALAGHWFSDVEGSYSERPPFRMVRVEGARQERLNALLGKMKVRSDLFVDDEGVYVVEQLASDAQGSIIHVIDVASARVLLEYRTDKLVHSYLPGRRELLLRSWSVAFKGWSTLSIESGEETTLFEGGYTGYTSADERYFFPVEDWSCIGLVDLASGELLDRKTKRHFARYATKVAIINVLRFDAERSRLYVALMKRQDLSYRSLITEEIIQLDVRMGDR